MGLNLSNRQIALELGLDSSDSQAITEQLRHRLVAKALRWSRKAKSRSTRSTSWLGTKGSRKRWLGRCRKLAGAPGHGTLEKDKPPVLGLIQRGGQVVRHMLAKVQQRTIKPVITAAVAPSTLVHTDEYSIYAALPWSPAWSGDKPGTTPEPNKSQTGLPFRLTLSHAVVAAKLAVARSMAIRIARRGWRA